MDVGESTNEAGQVSMQAPVVFVLPFTFFPQPFLPMTSTCHAIPCLTFLVSLVEIAATLTCINPY